jgi:hypothetical protein
MSTATKYLSKKLVKAFGFGVGLKSEELKQLLTFV